MWYLLDKNFEKGIYITIEEPHKIHVELECGVPGWNLLWFTELKLEQLERLSSEDTPRRLMIIHTIESYWVPSQMKTKSKLEI